MTGKLLLWPALALALGGLAFTGCSHYLAFGTATKFGLDITQKPDETIDVTMGYDRYELASIPVPSRSTNGTHARTASEQQDAYSVLATFKVKYGNPFLGEGLHLNQLFATGMAAQQMSQHEAMQEYFGRMASNINASSYEIDTNIAARAIKRIKEAQSKQ